MINIYEIFKCSIFVITIIVIDKMKQLNPNKIKRNNKNFENAKYQFWILVNNDLAGLYLISSTRYVIKKIRKNE